MSQSSTLSDVTPIEFFAKLTLKRGAPAPLKRVIRSQELTEWQTALAGGPPAWGMPNEVESVGGWPCFWSCATDELSAPFQKLVGKLSGMGGKSSERKAPKSNGRESRHETWWSEGIEELLRHPLSAADHWLLLDLYPLIAGRLSAEQWGHLAQALITQCFSDAERRRTQKSGDLLEQAEGAERAWRTAAWFPHFRETAEVLDTAAGTLRKLLDTFCDDEGTPRGEHVSQLTRWMGVWIRCAEQGHVCGCAVWDARNANRFRKVMHRSLAFCRDDGSLAPDQRVIVSPWSLLDRGLRSCDETAADLLLPRFLPVRRSRGGRRSKIPGISNLGPTGEIYSFQSDESKVSVLRTQEDGPTNLAVVTHAGQTPSLELQGAGRTLLQGLWTSRLRLGKTTLPIEGDWWCLCWQSDKDADYFEMQCKLKNGIRVERQVLLSRQGNFVVLAEAVANLPAGEFEHEWQIPLASGLSSVELRTTRELQIQTSDRVGKNGSSDPTMTARVFPLALPQWKRDSAVGSCRVEQGALTLRQSGQGQGTYFPVVIEWDGARNSTPALWRALTVTENLKVLGPDHASGHRVQVGKNLHVLIYRSLLRTFEPRACLGHQTRFETVIGRVNPDGEILPLMLVE